MKSSQPDNESSASQESAGSFPETWSGIALAIFIDDLDRCNKEYGIQLLEGLQTIFKKARVVYVIAADRKWLSTMFENQ